MIYYKNIKLQISKKLRTLCSIVTRSSKNDENFDKTIFKSAVGLFICLSKDTRSDIVFGKVARNSENPTLGD